MKLTATAAATRSIYTAARSFIALISLSYQLAGMLRLEGHALTEGDGARGCGVGFPIVKAGAPFVKLLLGSQAELDGCPYGLGERNQPVATL